MIIQGLPGFTLCIKKSDVEHIIPKFVSMIENQFKNSVKILRSDNAPELKLEELFNKKGILRQFSCVY